MLSLSLSLKRSSPALLLLLLVLPMPEKLPVRPVAPTAASRLPASVEEGRRLLAAEAPDITTTPVEPYGLISKILMRNAEAYVSPLGTIYANQDVLKDRSPQDAADTLLHELTHVRQARSRSPIERILEYFNQRGPYGQRPDEIEAYQAEKDRRVRTQREQQLGNPHFLSPTIETRGDIFLPNRK